jgi:hypothetical protein
MWKNFLLGWKASAIKQEKQIPKYPTLCMMHKGHGKKGTP